MSQPDRFDSLSALFEYLLPIGLQNGISITDYWDLTLGEIKAVIKASQKNKEDQVNASLLLAYHQAKMITHFIGLSFNGKDIPAFSDLYNQDDNDAKMSLAMKYKARMLAFAEGRHKQLQNKE